MAKQIANEQEFEDNLKKLGELYEEGKYIAMAIMPFDGPGQVNTLRLLEVLKEMRDLAAVQMQHKHWLNEN